MATSKRNSDRELVGILEAVEQMSALSTGLQYEVQHLAEATKASTEYGRTSRHYIRLLVMSLIFDVLLSVALGVIGVRAQHAAEQANKNSNVVVANCRAANETRRIETELWTAVLAFPPPVNETPAERAQRLGGTRRFKALIAKSFKPRDCEALQ